MIRAPQALNLIDLKTNRNITDERMRKLNAIKFSDLPLEQAIKQVRGNGKRVIATFEGTPIVVIASAWPRICRSWKTSPFTPSSIPSCRKTH